MDPLWNFKDVYPFGYLTGAFMISFSDQLTDPEEIMTISREMEHPPSASPAPPPQRGIKVGGYKKD